MITVQNIKEALTTKYVGKHYDSWMSSTDVLDVLREVLQNNGLVKESDKLWVRSEKQHLTVLYDTYTIGFVDIKKAKGESHYRYRSSWCDWSYKGFEVELYRDSIEDCIQMVAESKIKEKAYKDEQKEQAIEIVKIIMEKTGKTDTYDIVSICDYIVKNKYNLSDWMK